MLVVRDAPLRSWTGWAELTESCSELSASLRSRLNRSRCVLSPGLRCAATTLPGRTVTNCQQVCHVHATSSLTQLSINLLPIRAGIGTVQSGVGYRSWRAAAPAAYLYAGLGAVHKPWGQNFGNFRPFPPPLWFFVVSAPTPVPPSKYHVLYESA